MNESPAFDVEAITHIADAIHEEAQVEEPQRLAALEREHRQMLREMLTGDPGPEDLPTTPTDTILYLRRKGCRVESKIGGVLLVVRKNTKTFNLWPTHGKWVKREVAKSGHGMAYNRPTTARGTGLHSLLTELNSVGA